MSMSGEQAYLSTAERTRMQSSAAQDEEAVNAPTPVVSRNRFWPLPASQSALATGPERPG